MSTPVLQPAFSAGEISPELAARVDIEKYRVSAALMRGFYTDYRGGAVNRPGTLYCGIGLTPQSSAGSLYEDTINCRVIPFIFSQSQTYAIVVTPLRMRFISDGGYVVEAAKTITAITQASPGVVSVTSHGYSVDDLVYIPDTIAGMTQLGGRWFLVNTVPTANTFTLKTPISGNVVNTGAYGAFVSGTIQRAVTVTTPYVAADINTLDFVQSADVMTFFHQGYAPRTLTRNSHTSWVMATVTFASTIAAPTGTAVTGNMGGASTEYSYVVTAISNDNGDESVASTEGTLAAAYWSGSQSTRITWNTVSDALYYNIYRQPVTRGRNSPSNALFGLIGATKGLNFHDQQLAADYSQTPPINRTPFNATGKYPKTGTFHQQRLMYASTINKPSRIWGSVIGSFYNMSQSIPTRDTDSLEFQLASQRVDPVLWMLSMPAGLLVGTAGGVYQVSGDGENSPLTPTSIVSNQQTYIGSGDLSPVTIDYNILYKQAEGNTIRNLVYNFFANSFEAKDLTDLASHFFLNYGIVDWAYAPEPWKIVWCVRADGVLMSLTYYEKADVYAWALHQTNGFVKSVCCIPENGASAVYITVVRDINERYETANARPTLVERIQPRVINSIDDAWFVDCGLSTSRNWINVAAKISAAEGTATITTSSSVFSNPADVGKYIRGGNGYMVITAVGGATSATVNIITPVTDVTEYPDGSVVPNWWAPSTWSMDAQRTSVSGLDHLEGKSVYGLADGFVVGPLTVTNGAVTLPNAASYIVLGLQMPVAQVQTARVELEPTIQGRRKSVPDAQALLYRTRGLRYGNDFEYMYETPSRTVEPMGVPPALFTGTQNVNMGSAFQDNAQVCFEQIYPLPAQILGVVPNVVVGD